MRRFSIKQAVLIFGCCFGLVIDATARAELDPELASVSSETSNRAGMFAGAGLTFGQSRAVAKSRPRAAYSFLGEVGYMMPRGSWSRLEGALELQFGALNFKGKSGDEASYSAQVNMLLLAKFGYGYSLGGGAMAVWHAGIGPYLANFEAESKGVTSKSDGTISGVAGLIDVNITMPVSDLLDFVGGLRLTHYQMDVDELKAGGATVTVNESFAINVPALMLGARFKL